MQKASVSTQIFAWICNGVELSDETYDALHRKRSEGEVLPNNNMHVVACPSSRPPRRPPSHRVAVVSLVVIAPAHREQQKEQPAHLGRFHTMQVIQHARQERRERPKSQRAVLTVRAPTTRRTALRLVVVDNAAEYPQRRIDLRRPDAHAGPDVRDEAADDLLPLHRIAEFLEQQPIQRHTELARGAPSPHAPAAAAGHRVGGRRRRRRRRRWGGDGSQEAVGEVA